MYIRCQCSIIYQGSRVDKATETLNERSDYRNSTYSSDRKNQRHGQKGRNAPHRSASEGPLTKDEDHCPFSLAVYQDATGYYMKSTNCTGSHKCHPQWDQLGTPASLLVEEEFQLQEDLNSARANPPPGSTSSTQKKTPRSLQKMPLTTHKNVRQRTIVRQPGRVLAYKPPDVNPDATETSTSNTKRRNRSRGKKRKSIREKAQDPAAQSNAPVND